MRDRYLSLVCLFAGGALSLATHVVAQDGAPHDPVPVPRRALMLAQLCAHEAGWDADATGDCAAIHEVIWRGARREGMRYESFARTYARRLFTGSTSRAYFAQLDERGREPSTWPRTRERRMGNGLVAIESVPRFSHYRWQWLELLAYAASIVDREPEEVSPCASPVHDWGGSMDRERAARIGLIEVECGETRNDFYARPSLVQDDELVDEGVDNVEVDPD